jgi:hypothetical protein
MSLQLGKVEPSYTARPSCPCESMGQAGWIETHKCESGELFQGHDFSLPFLPTGRSAIHAHSRRLFSSIRTSQTAFLNFRTWHPHYPGSCSGERGQP